MEGLISVALCLFRSGASGCVSLFVGFITLNDMTGGFFYLLGSLGMLVVKASPGPFMLRGVFGGGRFLVAAT